MAKKKHQAEGKQETRSTFMFPRLHKKVLNAVSGEIQPTWFSKKGSNYKFTQEYSTYVMGKFTCGNNACSRAGWSSKKVAINIRRYPNNGYNAVVFNQRCEYCDRLGTLTLDEKSYVERMSYRLRRWAGIPTEEQHYTQKEGLPHKSELCEGCKRGYCQEVKFQRLD